VREGLAQGSIERGGIAPDFDAAPGNFAAGVKDDFLNQFLYAAWAGGALELASLDGLVCALPEGTTLGLSSTLPPVIMPGTGASALDVGLGDVRLSGTLTQEAAARFGASEGGEIEILAAATAGASVEVDAQGYRFGISLEGEYDLSLSILKAPDGIDLAMLAAEYEVALRCVAAELLEHLFNAYPLPALNLGSLGISGVPAQAAWQIGSPQLERQPACIAVSGDAVLR